jgi:SAM-dependent methyltransferase
MWTPIRTSMTEADQERRYDAVIRDHYKRVAEECGLSGTSTMADEITRRLETEAIEQFVAVALKAYREAGGTAPATIMDVGCGNGYTLERLVDTFPDQRFVGLEKSDELRALASSRFQRHENVTIVEGDIRKPAFTTPDSVDVLVCQRVLINLLDLHDQRKALDNIVSVLTVPGRSRASGKCLFIEAFSSYLATLNEARAELELPNIPPAPHNLYLPENFFDTVRLGPFGADSSIPPANFLSTHYYVTRVLHPYLTANKPFKRNSAFVAFFSEALKKNVGDFSPVRLCVFERV